MDSLVLLLKVLWSPGETMFRAAKQGHFWAPLLLLTASSALYAYVLVSHLDFAEMTIRTLERSGRTQQLSEEQKARIVDTLNGPVTRVIRSAFICLAPALTISIVAVAYFGLFTLVGRIVSFRAFFSVTTFAFVPVIIRHLISIATVLVVPQNSLILDEIGSVSLGSLVDRAALPGSLFTLLNQLDVISIWILLLLVIGYRFALVSKVGARIRAACVFSLWAVYIALAVVLQSFSQS